MWVRLIKGYTHKSKTFPIGKILNVSRQTYKDLMRKKAAEDCPDGRPPKNKTRTDFFKQK